MSDQIPILGDRAVILKAGVFSNAVCVPEDWTDEQIVAFVEKEYICGTSAGWYVAKPGDGALRDPVTKKDCEDRIACSDRKGFVHVVVTC